MWGTFWCTILTDDLVCDILTNCNAAISYGSHQQCWWHGAHVWLTFLGKNNSFFMLISEMNIDGPKALSNKMQNSVWILTIYVTRVLETFNWNLHTIDCMKAKFKRPTEVIKISMLTLECNSRKRTSNCQLLSHWPKKDDIIIHHVFSNTQYFNRKHAQRYK